MIKVCFASIVLIPALSFAADTTSINFANGPSVGLPLVDFSGGTGIDDSGYVSQLFYSTDGSSFSALGTAQPFFSVAPDSVRAGVWESAAFDFPVDVTPGMTLQLKVAVWDSNLFSDWASAAAEAASRARIPGLLNGLDTFELGITSAFDYHTPSAGDLNPGDYDMSAFGGLTLTEYTVVPEPSEMAWVGAGVSGLLFAYRRVSRTMVCRTGSVV